MANKTLDQEAADIRALTEDIDFRLSELAPLVAQRDVLQRAFDSRIELETGKKKA